MKSNWKNITIEVLNEHLGPAGVVIVNEVLKKTDLENQLITPAAYSDFLIKLSSELPGNINSIEVCRKCRELVQNTAPINTAPIHTTTIKSDWKEITIKVVSEQLGPVAMVIVNDVIEHLDLENKPVTSIIYSQFLLRLSSMLPSDINSVEICRKCRKLAI